VSSAAQNVLDDRDDLWARLVDQPVVGRLDPELLDLRTELPPVPEVLLSDLRCQRLAVGSSEYDTFRIASMTASI
jgi:hypothetical protein